MQGRKFVNFYNDKLIVLIKIKRQGTNWDSFWPKILLPLFCRVVGDSLNLALIVPFKVS